MTTEFTPFASAIGGAMIGASAVLLMATHGRIAGISGIAVRMFPPYLDKDAAGRLMFIIGLIAAPLLYATLTGGWAPMTIAGVLAFLSQLGCWWALGPSGAMAAIRPWHRVVALVVRSLVAVVTFMTTAIITVFITRHMI